MPSSEARRLRVVVVDDEPPARDRLRAMLDELADVEVVGEAGTGHQALAEIQRAAPDLVLLDIRMPGMDGLEVARHLRRLESRDRPCPAVVFTTAYEDHAIEAFEARAIDYLLKPIRRVRLGEALERVAVMSLRERARTYSGISGAPGSRSHLSARIGDSLHLVAVEEVRILRADNKYVTAVHPGGELVIDESLVALEAEFGDAFVRVHRSALAAVAHVQTLRRTRTGRYEIALAGVDQVVEVSRRLASSVRDRLQG